jgi:hypothetical protein
MNALEILYIVWYERDIQQWPKDIWQDRIKETYARECGISWRNNFNVILLTEDALRIEFSEVGHYYSIVFL